MFDLRPDPTDQTQHRPWPLPKSPWVSSQRWNNLLFMHWPVETAQLRALVPGQLELDRHDETAWVSIAPFYIDRLRARGAPAIPGVSEFPELNVRTYVTLGGKPGVWFFSLDAGSLLAVLGARVLYSLPYHRADMSITERPDGSFDYSSRRRGARFSANYRPTSEPRLATPGSLDHWLTERYCLYARHSNGQILRAEIHHVPWPLADVEVTVAENTMAASHGITLPAIPPRVSFTPSIDVVVWLPQSVVA